jgi:peptidoglycan/LPS O-acetylase OafA/YrhL
LSFFWRLYLVSLNASPDRIYGGFDTEADVLLTGCWLALVRWPAGTKEVLAKIWPVAALALGASFYEMQVTSFFAQAIGIAGAAIISAFLIVGSSEGILNRLLSLRPMTFIGKISYGLYLWHLPFIMLLRMKFPAVSPIYAIIAAYLTAVLSYYTVEKYFRNLKTRFEPTRTAMLRAAEMDRGDQALTNQMVA